LVNGKGLSKEEGKKGRKGRKTVDRFYSDLGRNKRGGGN
jgi:hypothetical protein